MPITADNIFTQIKANLKGWGDLVIDNEGGGYPNARISNARIGAEVTEGFKPTQVVDLPAMIGKSRQEITKMVGISPFKDENVAADWDLPEGRLIVFRNSIDYNLKSYSDFDPNRGVASPGEMAALINIDIQGREPEKIKDGVVAYRSLSANGKTLDLYIKMSDQRYMGASIGNFKWVSLPTPAKETFPSVGYDGMPITADNIVRQVRDSLN